MSQAQNAKMTVGGWWPREPQGNRIIQGFFLIDAVRPRTTQAHQHPTRGLERRRPQDSISGSQALPGNACSRGYASTIP